MFLGIVSGFVRDYLDYTYGSLYTLKKCEIDELLIKR